MQKDRRLGASVEPDEKAIYGWINPSKSAEDVKSERYRVVVIMSIRYDVHQYLDDIWQDWQLGVYRRTRSELPLPVEQREVFTFGIARNLCRSYCRKQQRVVPILDSATPPERWAAGVREQDLEQRRSDRASQPVNKPNDPPLAADPWNHSIGMTACLKRLQSRALEILRETYLDGKSSREVGEHTGLSPENVRQRLHRARAELRLCLEARGRRSEKTEGRNAVTHD